MMKKIFVLGLFVFFVLNLIGAADQKLVFDYSNTSKVADVNYDSFLLRINTAFDANCRYKTGNAGSLDYSDMEFFSVTGNKIHKEYFLNQEDKIVDVHIKCWNKTSPHSEIPDFKLTLNINSLITGKIDLSKTDPIDSGKLDVSLETSKIVSGVPTLEYSLDSKVYTPIPLTGSSKNWEGHIIIDNNFGEGVLSFRFKAKDLEGREGNMIISKNVFIVDTIPPGDVGEIKFDSESDGIKLEWEEVEDATEYKIYKSMDSDVDTNDYYKTIDDNDYLDSEVIDGEVYYYRIACVDEAGNVGDLSDVFYSRLEESNSSSGTQVKTLDPLLVSKVDSLLKEVDYLKEQVDSADSQIDSLDSGVEKFVEAIGIKKDLESLNRDLGSIESSAKDLKKQDLDEESLNNKLDQFYVRLRVIGNSIPLDINLVDTRKVTEELSDDRILDGLKNDNQFLSEGEYEKELDEVKKLIEEKNLEITSEFNHLQVSYGGAKKDFVFVKRNYNSVFEKMEGVYFVEIFPENLAGDLDQINVVNLNYNLKPDKNAIYFDTDTKEVNYYFEEDVFDKVGSIKSTVVYILPDGESSSDGITGFSVFSSGGINLTFAIIIGVFFILLVAYLFLKYKGKKETLPKEVSNKLTILKRLIDEGMLSEAKGQYDALKQNYSSLDPKSKKIVFDEINNIKLSLLVKEFEKDLLEYKENKSPDLLNKMQKVYNGFPKKYQDKLKKSFEAIK